MVEKEAKTVVMEIRAAEVATTVLVKEVPMVKEKEVATEVMVKEKEVV